MAKQGVSRRVLLGGMAAFALPTALRAEAPLASPLPRRRGDGGATRREVQDPASLIDAAKLGGAVGFVLADAVSGAVLEAHAPNLPQPPASVTKAITALYALDRLGPQHRFRTQVLATGPLVAGEVQGDLVLAGGGDPLLDSDMLGDLAASLAARGVKAVRGRYLAFNGALPAIPRIDAEQPDFVGYNPAISGLNLNFNRVHFEWRRAGQSYDLTMDARAERFVPAVRMASIRVEPRDQPLFAYEGAPGQDRWSVAQSALGKGGARWLPVRQPGLYAAEVFQTLCAAQGITLPQAQLMPMPVAGTLLAETVSAPLQDVLRDMLKFSTNLTAEVVGLAASGQQVLPRSADEMTVWAQQRHDLSARFVDHSGLGSVSRISAADMVKALVAAQSGLLPQILKNHGMRNADGKVIDDHPVQVHAKTGTLNFASALAGYIQPPGGRRMAFAFFAADIPRRAALTEAEREDPPGGDAWNKRARTLQARLIDRWAQLYA